MDDLWSDLKARGASAVADLCDRGQPEGQLLEFKSKTDPTTLALNREDRQNLGSGLSAFSNALGGILLWGIAPNKGGGETSAGTPAPISQIARFEDLVQGLVSEYLSPPNPDIEFLAIRSGEDAAYLAIKIGASDNRPHMSLAPGHQRYYLRSGQSTLPMVDFQVRDMLRIRTSPELTLKARLECTSRSGESAGMYLTFTILNASRVTARDAYLSVARNSGYLSLQDFMMRGTAANWLFVTARGLHPGLEADVAALSFEFEKQGSREATIRLPDKTMHSKCLDTSLEIRVDIGCEDVAAKTWAVALPGRVLEHAADLITSGRDTVEIEPRFIREVPDR